MTCQGNDGWRTIDTFPVAVTKPCFGYESTWSWTTEACPNVFSRALRDENHPRECLARGFVAGGNSSSNRCRHGMLDTAREIRDQKSREGSGDLLVLVV